MKYRTLGKTGLEVAEVGMGTWQLANDPNCWVGADLSESIRSLYKYVEVGGNFIDTAWVYGWDDEKDPEHHPSEALIGRYLKETGKRDQLILASKIPPKNMKWPAWREYSIDEVFPNKWIRSCVEDSLQSLGIEVIDLMQFHVWLDKFSERDEWKEEIVNLTKEGKVKHWGISANDYQPSSVLKTLDTGLISTVQFIFNIFHQKPVEKLLPYAREHNISLIARVPLDEGALTGKFNSQTLFAEGDFRNLYFKDNRLTQLEDRTRALREISTEEVKSLTELALRWVLSHPEVSTVIPGMRKVEYVDQNTSVSDGIVLSNALMTELKNHAWERNFYPNHDPSTESVGYME